MRLRVRSGPKLGNGARCCPVARAGEPNASMCGRYSLTTAIDALLPRLKGPLPEGLVAHYAPRPQVRPGEPVLLQRQEHGRLEVGLALWGLVPAWAKDPRGLRRPINARSETVAEKAFFRGPWRHRRALLPADGFYEWQKRADGSSQPWLFRPRSREPFWLGGCGSAGSGPMAASSTPP